MAPRGRPRKVGLTRMDAAIDALSPMGFSKTSIRRKVNALLKAYLGTWQFIEESSYRVLIEAMVEEQEENQVALREEQDEELGAIMDDQNIKAIEDGDSDSDDAGPSNTHDHVPEPSTRTTRLMTSTKQDPAKPAKESENIDTPQSGGVPELNDMSIGTTTCVQQLNRRQPCYGWISSGLSDDEEEFVYFETEASQRKGGEMVKKSRWDVKERS